MKIEVIISLLGALASWIAFFISFYKIRVKRKEEFEDHWNECREYRNDFWTPLENAYKGFIQNKENAPNPLIKLIEAVKMPPNLPVKKGRLLNDWIKDNKGNLNFDQRLMMDFVCSVYPHRDNRTGEVMDYSCIENSKKETFHRNRRKLTEFYEIWPRRLGIKYVQLSDRFKKNELYILCWLDIALRQWNLGDIDRGKEWMYRLGRE